jgi:hypothetical protein
LATRNVLLRTLTTSANNNNNGMTMQAVIADMGLARLQNREQTYQQTKAATAPLKVN